MANLYLATELVNAQANALIALLDNGYLRIYGGPQPEGADESIDPGTQPMLAELRFASPAAPPAVDGVVLFDTIAPAQPVANGDASWFRCFMSDGTPVFEGEIVEAPSVGDLQLSEKTLSTAYLCAVQSFTYAVLKTTD